MAIKIKDFEKFCEVSHRIMPLLSREVKVDYFYGNLSVIRQQDSIFRNEFECWQLYSRHSMVKFKECRELLIDLCAKSDVDISMKIPKDLEPTEENWNKYFKLSEVTRYHYNNIDITELIYI